MSRKIFSARPLVFSPMLVEIGPYVARCSSSGATTAIDRVRCSTGQLLILKLFCRLKSAGPMLNTFWSDGAIIFHRRGRLQLGFSRKFQAKNVGQRLPPI